MKDERLLAFYENVRQQVAIDAGSRYHLQAITSAPMQTSFATK